MAIYVNLTAKRINSLLLQNKTKLSLKSVVALYLSPKTFNKHGHQTTYSAVLISVGNSRKDVKQQKEQEC